MKGIPIIPFTFPNYYDMITKQMYYYCTATRRFCQYL